MAGTDPGDRTTPGESVPRRLERPPSDRYGARATSDAAPPRAGSGSGAVAAPGADAPSALTGPLARALLVSLGGAAALVAVGALLASTAGLLFVAGLSGGAIGLVLARAAVPGNDARPAARRTVGWLAVALALGAVAVAAVATWLIAQREGGTLGLIDYLVETFGPFIPGEAFIAAIAAAWGANAGPVQS